MPLKIGKRANYVMLILLVLLMITVLLLNGRLFYQMTNEQVEAVGRSQLNNVSAELRGTLYQAEILTRRVASDVAGLIEKNYSPDNLKTHLAQLNRDFQNESCINLYAAGDDWIAIPGLRDSENFEATKRSWYIGAKKIGVEKIYISAPYLDWITGDMCFTVSELLHDGKTVVAADFNLTALQKSIATISSGGGDALIVSSSGQIVCYADESVIGKNLSDALPQYTSSFQKILSGGESNMYFATTINGIDSVVFFSRTANDWYLLSAVGNWTLYKDNYIQLILNSLLNFILLLSIVALYVTDHRRRLITETALTKRENFIRNTLQNISSTMQELFHHSDYQTLMKSDSPKEHMASIRESVLKIERQLSDINAQVQIDVIKSAENLDTRTAAKVDLSSRTGKFVQFGIVAILFVTMLLCIGVSTEIMMSWGDTRMQREVDNYANNLNSWIVEQKSILEMFVNYISTNPEVLNDYQGAVHWLNDITSQYDNISVTYMTNPQAEHIVIMNNGWEPEPGWRLEDRAWYIGSLESEDKDGFNISAPYYDSQVGAYCVTFSERVYDKDGNFLGIFGIDYFMDKLTQIFGSSYTDDGYAFLVDSNGQIINHLNKNFEMTDTHSVTVEEAGYLNAIYAEDATIITDFDGKRKAALSVPNNISNFNVVGVKNWEVIYGNALKYDIVLLAIFGACILIVVYLLHLLTVWQRKNNALLQRSVEEATLAGKAKSQFLAQMSHEIRTPINAVLGMNEMILRESDNKDIHDYAQNIRDAGNTLLTLINSILDFSKIEDGKMEIVPANYDTASVINDLVNMVAERAQKKGLKFLLDIDSTLPKTLYGDDVRIRQIVTNLLTNAVKYTPKGSVTLCVKSHIKNSDNVVVRFEIADTGMGIKQEDMTQLFESFRRLEMNKNRTIEGTGLGIAIVQRLLVMMNSELKVDSVYGKGSKFYFDLEQKIIDAEEIGNYEERLAAGRKKTDVREFIYAPEARVLIVDDNAMNLKVARGLLKRSGIQIDTALNGIDAVDLAAKNFYDIIFLDHMMPEPDGIETLKIMRDRNLIPEKTAVVMMTANAIIGAREEYLHVGFDDYISKPIDINVMERLLKERLPKDKVEWRTAEKKSSEVIKPVADEKSRINRDVGLEYSMDDADFYREMLATYLEESDAKKSELDAALAAEDFAQYTRLIHGLKGNSKSVGAVEFADMAFDLEKAGKENRFDYIKEKHAAAMSEFDSVLVEIKKILEDWQ